MQNDRSQDTNEIAHREDEKEKKAEREKKRIAATNTANKIT